MGFKYLINVLFLVCFASFALAESSDEILNDKMIWKDESDQVVRLSQWRKSRVILTMSYTNCKKTCPMLTTAKLKELQAGLEKKGLDAEFVIISFDPLVDTPEILSAYKKKIKMELSNWHFLTGSEADTKALAKMLKLDDYWKVDDHIIHTFKIHILGPNGEKEGLLDWNNRETEDILSKLK